MKNLFLLLCIFAFLFSACFKNESNDVKNTQDCQNTLDYPNLPNSNFLDGYYQLLINKFTFEQLNDCSCEILTAIQDFRNINLSDYFPEYVPVTNNCDYLVNSCLYYNSVAHSVLVDSATISINYALNKKLISTQEYDLMSNFFNDYFINHSVDFDYYWCELELIEKSNNVPEELEGLMSAYTLTVFQSPYDFSLENETYFNTTQSSEKWIWSAVRGGIAWELIKKYTSSMYVIGEGLYRGEDTSYEALCTFLD